MLKGILIITLVTATSWVFFFQILIPWCFDEPMFAFFRHPEVRELEDMIVEAKQDNRLDEMSRELHDLRKPKGNDNARS